MTMKKDRRWRAREMTEVRYEGGAIRFFGDDCSAQCAYLVGYPAHQPKGVKWFCRAFDAELETSEGNHKASYPLRCEACKLMVEKSNG